MFALFIACSKENNEKEEPYIMCTIFPLYDWVKNICKDKIKIMLLENSAVDMHNPQPSAKDIINISNADIFIYVGGESDEWLDKVLNQNKSENRKDISLINVLKDNLKDEEIKVGMQDYEKSIDADREKDEHVWLSIKNACTAVREICDIICNYDEKNSTYYKSQADGYIKELEELDNSFEDCVKNAKKKCLIIADRFPFLYFFSDYNIDYYAAFSACTTENNASFSTIKFLADKTVENNLKNIFYLDGSDAKIADSILSLTGRNDIEKVMLDSMQNYKMNKRAKKTSYIDTMKYNLEVIRKALYEE